MKPYKIAYLSPYKAAAENQTFRSLALAAQSMGLSLEERTPHTLKADDVFDFVIEVAFSPKLTSHPSFLAVHSARQVHFRDLTTFLNVISHDGFLTISPKLRDLFTSISQNSSKRLKEVGEFYLCPQKSHLSANIERSVSEGNLGLCYFGINWDMRAEGLLSRLSSHRFMRIYGPKENWKTIEKSAYVGELPFDGESVQIEYAKYGVGLICQGHDHLLDDIVSNRIFEISSVGAVAIAPRTPWMEETFGENVFYYDAFSKAEVAFTQVEEAFDAIRRDPKTAAAKARRARSIFEERYQARVMLENAVAFFERWKAAAGDQTECGDPVDVILLGEEVSAAAETVLSLDRQRRGLFRVHVLECEGELLATDRVMLIRHTLNPKPLSGASLVDGLKSSWVCVARAGDIFLSHHFEPLFNELADVGASAVVATNWLTEIDGVLAVDAAEGVTRPPPPLASLLIPREEFAGARNKGGKGLVSYLIDLSFRVAAVPRWIEAPQSSVIVKAQTPAPKNEIETAVQRAFAPAPIPLRPGLRAFQTIAASLWRLEQTALDSVLPLKALEQGMSAQPLEERADYVGIRVPLTSDRIIASNLGFCEDGAVNIKSTKPYELSLQLDVEDLIIPGLPCRFVFNLKSARSGTYVGVIDREYQFLARAVTINCETPLQMWAVTQEGRPSKAVIQAGPLGTGKDVEVKSVFIAYRVADLAELLGSTRLARTEAQSYVSDRLHQQLLGFSRGFSWPSQEQGWVHINIAEESINLNTGTLPYDYFKSIVIPREFCFADGEVLMDLESTEDAFSILFTDRRGARLPGPPILARARKHTIRAQLPIPESDDMLLLVFQAPERPTAASVRLRGLWCRAPSRLVGVLG